MTLPALPNKVPSEIPLNCRVLCVGEAPGKNENDWLRPFIGGSGQLLRWGLQKVGFDAAEVGFTNVLPYQPPENKLHLFCISRAELREHTCPDWYKSLPPTIPGKIVHPSLGVPALEELYDLVDSLSPSIILALGNTACWALLRQTGIEKLRGAPVWDNPLTGEGGRLSHKVLPTYHPAAITRNYKLLSVFLLDLLKAKNESETVGIVWPERWIEIAPTVARVRAWLAAMAPGGSALCGHAAPHLAPALRHLNGIDISLRQPRYVAVDVETERVPGPQITLIGFAPRPEVGLVIPFINPANEDRCHFTFGEEKEVIRGLIKPFMENKAIPKLFHNCLYDLQWIHSYGINPQNAYHDSMLMSHALWPEMRKSLRLLGSILTQERNWKFLRAKSSKREDF